MSTEVQRYLTRDAARIVAEYTMPEIWKEKSDKARMNLLFRTLNWIADADDRGIVLRGDGKDPPEHNAWGPFGPRLHGRYLLFAVKQFVKNVNVETAHYHEEDLPPRGDKDPVAWQHNVVDWARESDRMINTRRAEYFNEKKSVHAGLITNMQKVVADNVIYFNRKKKPDEYGDYKTWISVISPALTATWTQMYRKWGSVVWTHMEDF